MRKHQTWFLDISKKPGDSTAVRTVDDILKENEKLKRENKRLKQGGVK